MHEKHVPDREHCQELDRLCKEKGIVVPETEFVWAFVQEHTFTGIHLWKRRGKDIYHTHEGSIISKPTAKLIPAPLVSEQGECLPEIIDDDGMDARFVSYKNNSIWTVMYGLYGMEIETHSVSADNEPNARQKMINYLLAEGIITTL